MDYLTLSMTDENSYRVWVNVFIPIVTGMIKFYHVNISKHESDDLSVFLHNFDECNRPVCSWDRIVCHNFTSMQVPNVIYVQVFYMHSNVYTSILHA